VSPPNPFEAPPEDLDGGAHAPTAGGGWLRTEAGTPTRKASVFAVVIGVLIDFGSTEAVRIGYVVWLGWMVQARGVLEPLDFETQTLVLMTLGASCSVLGGFVCGLLTPRRELFHTFVQGMVGEVLVLTSAYLGREQSFADGYLASPEQWLDLSDPREAAGHCLNVVVPLLGGLLAVLRRRLRERRLALP
jgi:hypothetical protein